MSHEKCLRTVFWDKGGSFFSIWLPLAKGGLREHPHSLGGCTTQLLLGSLGQEARGARRRPVEMLPPKSACPWRRQRWPEGAAVAGGGRLREHAGDTEGPGSGGGGNGQVGGMAQGLLTGDHMGARNQFPALSSGLASHNAAKLC